MGFLIEEDAEKLRAFRRRMAKRLTSAVQPGLPGFRKPMKDQSKGPTMLDQIDALIKVLEKNKEIFLSSPDGKTEWWIKLSASSKPLAYWKEGPKDYWRDLNPGWRPTGNLRRIDVARILIGQILVGTRDTGYRLENLYCGGGITDGKRSGYAL